MSRQDAPGRQVSLTRIMVVVGWFSVVSMLLVTIHGPFWRGPDRWFRDADAALADGDSALALERVERALSASPDDPGLRTFRGHLLLRAGRARDARADFERALVGDADAEAGLGLAAAHLALGDRAAARSVLEELSIPDGERERIGRQAALADAAGSPAAALAALERIAAPSNRRERIRLAMAAEAWPRAVEMLREALDVGEDQDLRRDLARTLVEAGHPGEALVEYERLAATDGLDAGSAVQWAWLLDEEGRYHEALVVLEDPRWTDDPEARLLRARTALWLGDTGRAQREVEGWDGGSTPELVEVQDRIAEERARRDRLAAEARRRQALETPPEDPAHALVFWRSRLHGPEADPRAREETVALLESMQRFDEAREVLLDGREADAVRDPSELARLTRLALWSGRADEAAGLALRLESAAVGRTTPEEAHLIAESLLEAGRPDDALWRLEVLVAGRGASDDALLLAARAASDADEPRRAALHLERLGAQRRLTSTERAWLADSYRATGHPDAALSLYQALRVANPEDRTLTLTVADLRLETGDAVGAADLYAAARTGPGDPASRGLALALQRTGRIDEAMAVLQEHVEARPEDGEARLSLARMLASVGREAHALAEYLRLGEADEEIPALEIARLHLATGEHADAETWARRAVAGTGDGEALLTLAAALRYQGRTGEASKILEELAGREVPGWEGDLWQARIAHLLDQPLRAQRILTGALEGEGGTDPEGWLLLGTVALERGDLRRAGDALERAAGHGAPAHRIERLRGRLDEARIASVAAAVHGGSAATALDQREAEMSVTARPAGGAARLTVTAGRTGLSGTVRDADVTSLGIQADSLYLTPALRAAGRLTLDMTTDGADRASGGLELVRDLPDGSEVAAEVSRDPLWAGPGRVEPLRRGAVREPGVAVLDVLGTDLRLRARLALGIQENVSLEAGATSFSDGNRRWFSYGQYQVPLSTSVSTWLVLQPNLYLEGYRRQVTSYASPSSYGALGVRARAVLATGRWHLDAGLNPHVFRHPAASGVGLDGRARLRLDLGPVDLEVGALLFRQENGYDLHRLSGGFRLPVGGTR